MSEQHGWRSHGKGNIADRRKMKTNGRRKQWTNSSEIFIYLRIY